MSNTNKLQVKVASRKSGSEEWWEGTVSLSGLKPTKLARKSDDSTRFVSRSAVTQAARNLAKSLGYADVDFGEQAAPVKKAAKQTVKSAKPKTKTETPQS